MLIKRLRVRLEPAWVKHPFLASLLNKILALSPNIRLSWKCLPETKRSSLFDPFVNHGCERLYNIGPRLHLHTYHHPHNHNIVNIKQTTWYFKLSLAWGHSFSRTDGAGNTGPCSAISWSGSPEPPVRSATGKASPTTATPTAPTAC